MKFTCFIWPLNAQSKLSQAEKLDGERNRNFLNFENKPTCVNFSFTNNGRKKKKKIKTIK